MGNETIKFWAGAALALCLAAGVAGCNRPGARAPVPPQAEAQLLARADLFGDPVRQNAQLSPRGDRIAFLAPRDGSLNIWVVSVAAMDQPRPITDDQDRGIRDYAWAHDGATLLYLQDEGGDENWRLFAVPAAGGEPRALTPAGARATILGLSVTDPTGVVITLNQRDAAWPDVFRVDINSGSRTLMQRNANGGGVRGFASFLVDRDNQLKLGLKTLADGAVDVFSRDANGGWSRLFTIPFEDAVSSRPLAFEADGRFFLMLDLTGRDRAALVRVDSATGVKTVLGESQRADVADVWLDPGTNAVEAYAADYLRRDWRALEPDAQADLDFLDDQLTGDPSVVSRSLDDARWLVVEDSPTSPARTYLYDRTDRANRRLTMLFRQRPALEQAPLQPMTPVEIEARDGLTLVSYLTLPIGSDANGDARPDAPAPLVLVVHDGPWSRDSYGFNPTHQWLANRGYAVLSVNFRGSAGFGKAFLNAGNREWGGKMQEDLLDAVQWAVESGIAQPERVAIMGGSYGGYAALAGLAFTPERFRCGVSLAGVANLSTALETLPPVWTAYRDAMYLRIGDPRTAEGRQMLRERSPASRASEIRAPLLLALGANDPRVSRTDNDQIAQALRGRRSPLIYLNYPDEGHGLTRAPNRLSYYAIAEHFLGECLGGSVEPVGTAFEGANMQALDGADSVPGLSAFARRAAPAPVQPVADDEPADGGGAGGPAMEMAPAEDASPSNATNDAAAPSP